MPTYILLLTLTPEGREKMVADSASVRRAGTAVGGPDIQVLGLYGVLGDYDFVSIVEAPDNEAMARFSLELGVRAGVHIATLPAIPISRLEARGPSGATEAEVLAGLGLPDELSEPDLGPPSVPPSEESP